MSGGRSQHTGRHLRKSARPEALSGSAYGQRPVLRTLVTLLVGAAVCLLIVGLGELGILHYPERQDAGPEPTQQVQQDEPPAENGTAPEQGETGGASDGATDGEPAAEQDGSDSSSSASGTTVASTELRDMLDAGEVVSIRVLGDSITAGYLCDGYDAPSDTDITVYSGPQGTYEEAATTVRCWTNDFRSYATQHGVSSFVNAGIDGFRMQYLAEDPSAWLGDGADVIVVMLGTNDAARRTEEEFSADAEIGLAAATARCKLLVVVSPPANDRTDATNLYSMARVDQILSELCKMKGYVHVSLLDALQLGTDDYNPDLLHPTTTGSDKLWESLRTQLALA